MTFKLDSHDSLFFTRELEKIESKLFEIKYAQKEALQFLNLVSGVGPLDEIYTYRMMDMRGVAHVGASYEARVPLADINATESSQRILAITEGVHFNFQELRQSRLLGKPIDEARMLAARRAITEAIDNVLLKGHAATGVLGLFNQTGTTISAPAGSWASASADAILADMVKAHDDAYAATQFSIKPNMILMPHGEYLRISAKRAGVDTGLTVLELFQQMRPGVTVRGAFGLETAGVSNSKRLIAFNNDAEYVGALLPVPLEIMSVREVSAFAFEVPMHARCGGVVVRYPKSISYMDGI